MADRAPDIARVAAALEQQSRDIAELRTAADRNNVRAESTTTTLIAASASAVTALAVIALFKYISRG